MKSLRILSPFLLGFFCLGFQIIVVREFSSVFWGNELNFGVILGFWLFWEGIGALIAEKINFDESKIYKFYSITIFFFMVSLTLLRLNRFLAHKLPGEIPPLFWVIVISAISTLLVSLFLGILFVLNVKFLGDRLSMTYILESTGSAFGSIFVYFIIVPHASNWVGTTVIGLIGIFFLFFIFKPNLRLLSISLFLISALLLFGFFADNILIRKYWFPLQLIISKDSKFGKISVLEEGDEMSVYENSVLSFSSYEKEAAEESVHFPLLTASSPKIILIIGGGLGGALREALKYKDIRIDYLELDPEIIRISRDIKVFKKYFDEKRITFHWGDARSFLQKERKNWDCIIMSLPEPINAQINRLYTKEFYNLIKQRLKNKGIFSFKVPSSAEYINLDLQKVISIHFNTLKDVFPYINYIPGSSCIFLASQEPFEISIESILNKKEKLGVETSFINERYLRMRMSPIRYLILESAFKTEKRVNSDFKPSLYLFQLSYLSGYHGKIERKFYNFLVSVSNFWFIEFPLIIFAIFLLFKLFKRKSTFYMMPVFGIGFTTLSMEILIVFAYQIFYGYFYGRIALLLFSFMVGLALGSFIANFYLSPSQRLLLIFQFLMLFITSLSFLFFRMSSLIMRSSICHFSMFLLLFFFGVVSGSIFIIANELFTQKKKRFGLGWAVDLGGSTIGALSISTILLPVVGFFPLLKFFLIFNLLILLFLVKFNINFLKSS